MVENELIKANVMRLLFFDQHYEAQKAELHALHGLDDAWLANFDLQIMLWSLKNNFSPIPMLLFENDKLIAVFKMSSAIVTMYSERPPVDFDPETMKYHFSAEVRHNTVGQCIPSPNWPWFVSDIAMQSEDNPFKPVYKSYRH